MWSIVKGRWNGLPQNLIRGERNNMWWIVRGRWNGLPQNLVRVERNNMWCIVKGSVTGEGSKVSVEDCGLGGEGFVSWGTPICEQATGSMGMVRVRGDFEVGGRY